MVHAPVQVLALHGLRIWFDIGLDQTQAMPKLGRIAQRGLTNPAARDIELIPIAELFIINRSNGDCIPVAGELEFFEIIWICARANLVQLDKRNGRFEMLISKLRIGLSLELASTQKYQQQTHEK